MLMAMLESSPTSARYNMNICGKIAGVSGVDKIAASVYIIELSDIPYQKISTTTMIEFTA
jgi:hypothetical protein